MSLSLSTRAPRYRWLRLAGLGFTATLLTAAPALAIKPFTLIEDAYPEATGQLELENTLETTWHSRDEHSFKEWSVEHELEYGYTNNLTLRVKGSYVYTDSADARGLHFGDGGVEAEYYFTNPNTDPLGIAVIVSGLFGERGGFSTEDFLVIQKDTDKFIFLYNLGVVTEVENLLSGGDHNTTGTIINAAGFEYSVNPRVRVGIEASVESEFEDWSHYTRSTMYGGPVINITPTNDLWISIGLDYQLTGHRDTPEYRLALIVGYYF